VPGRGRANQPLRNAGAKLLPLLLARALTRRRAAVPYVYGGSKYARNPPVPADVRSPLCFANRVATAALLRLAHAARALQVHVVRDYGRDYSEH